MCVHIKVHWKTFRHFYTLHFLPYFVPHAEFKGSPEYAAWNVLYHTSLRNYVSFKYTLYSIQGPDMYVLYIIRYGLQNLTFLSRWGQHSFTFIPMSVIELTRDRRYRTLNAMHRMQNMAAFCLWVEQHLQIDVTWLICDRRWQTLKSVPV